VEVNETTLHLIKEYCMYKNVIAGLVAAAALASVAAPASACPSGYVKGWIQGNKVCHIPPGGNNQLKANTAPKPQADKKAIRPAQRAYQ
jgi:hypothetical protein